MTEYACRVKHDAYMSRALSTAWRASMSGMRAYAEGVGTLNVGKRGRWTVRHTVTSLPSCGTPRSALRPIYRVVRHCPQWVRVQFQGPITYASFSTIVLNDVRVLTSFPLAVV